MAFKIWVNIFGVIGDPKISAKFCEKNFPFSPPGGAERLISRLPGIRKIGSNSCILIDRVKMHTTIGFSMKKYTTLVYLKLILGQTGQLGALKTCFGVVPRWVKTRFWISQPPHISQKRFEMYQGCVFLHAESDGTIYFGLSAEMKKL